MSDHVSGFAVKDGYCKGCGKLAWIHDTRRWLCGWCADRLKG